MAPSSGTGQVRQGRLRFMYGYTIVGAGGFGLGLLFLPGVLLPAFGFPAQDPFVLGIVGSAYVAFGLLSILGLRSPEKFVPLLAFQLCYKSIWLIAVLVPRALSATPPLYSLLLAAIFVSYVVGDLVAIPFSAVFARERER